MSVYAETRYRHRHGADWSMQWKIWETRFTTRWEVSKIQLTLRRKDRIGYKFVHDHFFTDLEAASRVWQGFLDGTFDDEIMMELL